MRAVRFAVSLLCQLPAVLGACRPRADRPSPPNDLAESHSSAATRDGGVWAPDAAIFSAPIGAVRVGSLDVVAGLVAKQGIVRAIGRADGALQWTADALTDVAWAPDTEIRVLAAAGGVAVVWRGLRHGKPVRTMVLLGPRGEPRGEPIEVGPTLCGTADGLAWTDPRAAGPVRVHARRWSEPAVHDVALVPADREPSLVCGDRAVVILGEGDDDLIALRFVPGDAVAQPLVVALRDADFADEEREHEAYSTGNDLGLVRVGASGSVALRRLPPAGAPGPWHRLKHRLPNDDDVVAVDGDSSATWLVVTHDSDDLCDGSGSTQSVYAVRVDRATGEESILDVASGDCERSAGPFWIALGPPEPTIAWVERRAVIAATAAPIAGVAFRVLGAEGIRGGRIDQPADALVAGGCGHARCAVAALVREAGGDGSQPAAIRVLEYP